MAGKCTIVCRVRCRRESVKSRTTVPTAKCGRPSWLVVGDARAELDGDRLVGPSEVGAGVFCDRDIFWRDEPLLAHDKSTRATTTLVATRMAVRRCGC